MGKEKNYQKSIEIRWSDLDPNFHVRHSAYYDMGAYIRVAYLTEHGLTTGLMREWQIGPVLLREECVFRKEIHFSDPVSVNIQLLKSSIDGKRWTMTHEIVTHPGILHAVITVDGAWMDTVRRKLVSPPEKVIQVFQNIPLHPDYRQVEK